MGLRVGLSGDIGRLVQRVRLRPRIPKPSIEDRLRAWDCTAEQIARHLRALAAVKARRRDAALEERASSPKRPGGR